MDDIIIYSVDKTTCLRPRENPREAQGCSVTLKKENVISLAGSKNS